MIKLDLPQPDAAALEHSAQLAAIIRNTIAANAGWIDFSQYMQLALYAPGLGYYSAGLQKFGAAGDFITAPEVSPLFAQSLATPVAQCLGNMSDAVIMEFGAGSGKLAADILLQLEQLNVLPDAYFIIELSAELQQRQANHIQQQVPHLYERVVWLQSLPTKKINAVVLANEVLDAMPVTQFIKQDGQVFPLGVTVSGNALAMMIGAANAGLQNRVAAIESGLGYALNNNYRSEMNGNIQPWFNAISALLNQAAVFIIDYGYARPEYYLPERNMGTLMCYYQHRSFDDALRYPGLQDMTAFVDFTAVAEAATTNGFELYGYTTQAHFLMDCGLPALLEKKLTNDERTNLQWIQQMKTLTLPSEMGERFKVMALTKNISTELSGFNLQDLRYSL